MGRKGRKLALGGSCSRKEGWDCWEELEVGTGLGTSMMSFKPSGTGNAGILSDRGLVFEDEIKGDVE